MCKGVVQSGLSPTPLFQSHDQFGGAPPIYESHDNSHRTSLHKTSDKILEDSMKLFVNVVCILLFASQKVQCAGSDGSPLSRASAKPVNVDPKLDCAIKELAWDFANQLLTEQV